MQVKKEQVKIQPQVHPQRKLQRDQKGMPGKYIILPVENTAVTWVVFLTSKEAVSGVDEEEAGEDVAIVAEEESTEKTAKSSMPVKG